MKPRSFPTLIITIVVVSFMLQTCTLQDHGLVQPGNTQARLQQLTDSLYNRFNAKWKIDKGGIFMRVSNPRGSYLVSSNFNPPVQDNSHFRIASISKTFTAAAIMRLYQEGQLSLDDVITKYLPNTPTYNIPNKDQITIRLLLQHRAGVFDVTNQLIPKTVKQLYAGHKYYDYVLATDTTHTFNFDEEFTVISQNGLVNHLPNAQFYYSNSGYHILAKIVEIVQERRKMPMSFNEYITKTFFEPLKLTNTYGVVLGTDQQIKAPYLESHIYTLVKGTPTTFQIPPRNMSGFVSDGHIVSTPADISRWMELLISGQAGISQENVNEMKKMLPADAEHGLYGLGLVFNQGLGYGHDGFQPAYLSTVRYNPDTKTTVFIASTFLYTPDLSPEVKQPSPEFLELAYGLLNTGIQAAQIINR